MNSTISYKNIIKVAWPIALSGLATSILNVTDTAFLGHVSEVDVGAAGNAGLLYFLIVIMGLGFSVGIQIMIGKKNGEKDYGKIGGIFNHSLYFILPFSVITFLLIYYGTPFFYAHLIKDEAIRSASSEFIHYRIFGIFPALLIALFEAFYVGITKTRVLSVVTLFAVLINIVLDYALIFGHFGFSPMGIKGAALASTTAEYGGFLFILIYTLIKVDRKKYNLFRFKMPSLKVFAPIFKLSAPVMLQSFISFGSWYIFFNILEKLGARELAASHIIRSVYMFIMIPIFSISTTANTLCSNLMGANKPEQVSDLVKRSLLLALSWNIIMAFVNIVFANDILHIFSQDPTLITEAHHILYVITGAMFFFTFAMIYSKISAGAGKTFDMFLLEAIGVTVYLTATYIFVIHYKVPVAVAWCAEFVYFITYGSLVFWYYKSNRWKNSKSLISFKQ